MTVRLQCILPCKYKCENHLCCYNSNWHGKHGCHRYTHWHLRTKRNCRNVTWQRQTSNFWVFKERVLFLFVGNFILLFAKSYVMIIPWHEWMSPVYPSLQVQMWEPSVLVQFAVTSQAWLLLRHSSISGSTYDIDRIIRAKSVFMVFTHEIVVSKVEGVNAANEWDFWYKATIVYIPYGLTICDVLGLLYSIHYIRRVNSSFIAFNCQTDNGL